LNDLAASAAGPDWLWDGYLAAGNVTLLTSPWKAGKTTLTAALLSRMAAGGAMAGSAVRPGKALVLSEEAPALWNARRERFPFGPHICWVCRPFAGKPTAAQWLDLVGQVATLQGEHGFALLVIDPLASFLPGRAENDAAAVLAALLPLQRLTTAGLAVLLLHHPRKQAAADGHWARGSGALMGFVDVLIEMQYFSPASADDRRRKLLPYSRHEGGRHAAGSSS
jgi:RecA-family ATPase